MAGEAFLVLSEKVRASMRRASLGLSHRLERATLPLPFPTWARSLELYPVARPEPVMQ